MSFQINAEFKRIATTPLQSRFLSQLDLLSQSLLRVFAKRSGEQGKKLKDIAAMMTVRTFKLFNYKVYMHCIRSVKDICIHCKAQLPSPVRTDSTERNHHFYHAFTVPLKLIFFI